MAIARVRESDAAALDRAVAALQEDGVVLIEDAIDTALLGRIKRRMDEDSVRLLAYCERIGGNPRTAGQLQQSPPPFLPYLHKDLLAHAFVWAMIDRLLGPRAGLIYYSGNTNCPGSQPQNVHLDQEHKSAQASAIRSLVVSIPAQPMSARNGAIEIWPGTHTIVSPQPVPEEMLAARRERRPPLQVETRLGDILVRDPRLWHRAMSNPSDEFRHVLSAVYHAEPKGPVTLDERLREIVESVDVNLNAVFADLSEDYLEGPTRWLKETRDKPSYEPQESHAKVARPLPDL